MNNRRDSQEPIKYVLIGKFANTKNWQLPLKQLDHTDKQGHIQSVIYVPDANTIYASEYKGSRPPQSVWFHDGELLVRPSDQNLITILAIHPWRDRFFKKFNQKDEALEKLSKNDLIKKALKLIDISDINQLKATAFAVLDNYAFNMDDDVMRADLEAVAFENPKWLISELTDPNFHTKQIAALSVLKGILKINPERTAINWPNGKILVSVPPGQDAIKRLGEYLAENTNEAKITLQELGQLNKHRRQNHQTLTETVEEKINEAFQEKTDAAHDNMKEQGDEVDDQGLETSGYEEMSLEDLQATYEVTLGKAAPNSYKNNREWLIEKIAEKPVEA